MSTKRTADQPELKGSASSKRNRLAADASESVKQKMISLFEQKGVTSVAQAFCSINGDEKISRAEFTAVLRRLEIPGLDEQKIVKIVGLVDTDGDGSIDYKEFEEWIESANNAAQRGLATIGQFLSTGVPTERLDSAFRALSRAIGDTVSPFALNPQRPFAVESDRLVGRTAIDVYVARGICRKALLDRGGGASHQQSHEDCRRDFDKAIAIDLATATPLDRLSAVATASWDADKRSRVINLFRVVSGGTGSKMTPEQFVSAAARFGITGEDAAAWFRAIDLNNAGVMSCRDFCLGLAAADPTIASVVVDKTAATADPLQQARLEWMQHRARYAFRLHDKNNDGSLDVVEFSEIIRQIWQAKYQQDRDVDHPTNEQVQARAKQLLGVETDRVTEADFVRGVMANTGNEDLDIELLLKSKLDPDKWTAALKELAPIEEKLYVLMLLAAHRAQCLAGQLWAFSLCITLFPRVCGEWPKTCTIGASQLPAAFHMPILCLNR
eukprot:SAG31_NODE_2041_length_6590_cov_2.334155_4_plen_498_part_00